MISGFKGGVEYVFAIFGIDGDMRFAQSTAQSTPIVPSEHDMEIILFGRKVYDGNVGLKM